jgi:hypothetical protein
MTDCVSLQGQPLVGLTILLPHAGPQLAAWAAFTRR